MTRRETAFCLAMLIVLGGAWGMTMPLTKIAVSTGYKHFGLLFWQMAIGVVVMSAIALLRGTRLPMGVPQVRIYVLIALIGSVLPNTASYQAAVHLPSGVMSILLSMIPMWAFPIAVLLTLSLNIINGYMGEFSCSHPGFMAIGAYMSSLFTVGLFVDDKVLGDALLGTAMAYLSFPVALIFGGMCAAVCALIVAIPSFRTRGDYLAIISLAFLFIVKSFFENMQNLGGARGIMGQPNWATLPVIFVVVVFGVWAINNFVTSTLGKALNTVRDDEMAGDAMTVDTRKTKMVAFLFGAFWAGLAGGLLAHVLRFINPAMFGIQKLAEVLAMVYFGGLNSVYGSIVGAVSISLLGEVLRPLEILKWIFIPLLLILVMIYRPTGLVAFKEFNVRKVFGPKEVA